MLKKISLAIINVLILFSTVCITQTKEFSVESIYSNRDFFGKGLSGVQWFDGGEKYSFMKMDPEAKAVSIFQHIIKTGAEEILISANQLKINEDDKPFSIQNYSWSPDERYVLFTGVLFARSIKTGGTFYIYDTWKKNFFILAESDEEQVNATFSPDSKKLAFVRNNNIWCVDIETRKETQLTFDGSDVILNGLFDWVYEEEFSIINGIEWSPDSKKIAFWRLDQSPEPIVKIQKYDSLHLNFYEMRYPKAGDNNAIVKIGIVNLENNKVVWASLGEEKDFYIPRIKFTADPNLLSIQRMNRLQNKMELLFADALTGKSKTILTFSDPCWVDVNDDLTFLKDKKHFIWSSEQDGWNHLYLFDYDGKLINQITKGEWEVDKLLQVDEANKILYYTSSERSPLRRDLYSISFDGKDKKRLSEDEGTHVVNVSPNCKYFIDRYSNINKMTNIYLYQTDGVKLSDLVVNDMATIFKEYNLAKTEILTFITEDGVELNCWMMKPANFEPDKKYPVLFDIYGGPGSQAVLDQWGRLLWNQLLAQKGYIVFSVDPRGTGFRGKAFRNLAYKKMGYWESNDFIQAAKYLSSLPYIDSKRIGIWGWSYGGFSSALTLFKGADYFKMAIAVAPVTNWRFYDNIYTERYMSLPKYNEAGYDTNSVLHYVNNYKGKLLLVHGTLDDNVHFQNSVKLVEKLIDANKQFQTMFYPEKEHSIYGGMARIHLYNMMLEFILREL